MGIMFRFSELSAALAAITLISFGLLTPARGVSAPACHPLVDNGSRYTVCTYDARTDKLQLFWRDPEGKPYGGYDTLASSLKQVGKTLAFGMNAGMYHPDSSPVGLYVEEGRQIIPANTRSGAGNFHLKPNGIFYFGRGGAGVMETERFLKAGINADYATQSGPMLVINGAIHPKIEPTGTSEKIRNGVGVKDGHIIVFAISDEPVTFYKFASLFRDTFGCPNALFLDGSISSLYAPALGRADRWQPMGPIVGVVENAGR
jgi:uncharacterized protein YigE (DUF2233 family)